MTLKWLAIGIGDIARKRVLPAILREPRSELYGLLTRDPAKAQAYPEARVFTALDDALRDPAIDAVYVASPVALHAPQTIASLRAGKHVLCEKPVALNYPQAESMVAAARESRRLFGVAYYRRLYPKLLRTRELIADGAIGKPVLAEANCHSWLPSRSGVGCGTRRWRVAVRSTTSPPTALTPSTFSSGTRRMPPDYCPIPCTSWTWKTAPRYCRLSASPPLDMETRIDHRRRCAESVSSRRLSVHPPTGTSYAPRR